MSDMIDELREKQREMDDLRRQARERDDARMRSHVVDHQFGDGTDTDTAPADDGDGDGDDEETVSADVLRERVAEIVGFDPEGIEAVPADAVVEILAGLAETDEAAGHEHTTADRSPKASMVGVQSRGSTGDDEDGTDREHTADRDGWYDNGYPIPGREAWRKRNSVSSDDGYSDNGHPAKGRDAWRKRNRVSSSSDGTEREHTVDRSAGNEAAGSTDGTDDEDSADTGSLPPALQSGTARREAWRKRNNISSSLDGTERDGPECSCSPADHVTDSAERRETSDWRPSYLCQRCGRTFAAEAADA